MRSVRASRRRHFHHSGKKASTHLSTGNLPPNFSRSPRWKCFAIFSPPFNSRYFFVALRKNMVTLLKYSSGRFRVLTHSSSSGSHRRRRRRSRVWLQTFCCLPPSVCRPILTSNVRNNEINIKLLNISVHSRSKVEVFFLTDPTTPPPQPATNPFHKCIVLSGQPNPSPGIWRQRKSTFPRWVFFSSASAAVSAGTRETWLMDTLVITGRELWDPLPIPSQPLSSPPPPLLPPHPYICNLQLVSLTSCFEQHLPLSQQCCALLP